MMNRKDAEPGPSDEAIVFFLFFFYSLNFFVKKEIAIKERKRIKSEPIDWLFFFLDTPPLDRPRTVTDVDVNVARPTAVRYKAADGHHPLR